MSQTCFFAIPFFFFLLKWYWWDAGYKDDRIYSVSRVNRSLELAALLHILVSILSCWGTAASVQKTSFMTSVKRRWARPGPATWDKEVRAGHLFGRCFQEQDWGSEEDRKIRKLSKSVKNLTADWSDPGLIPGLGRFSGEGNDNPLQYSCLENPMDSRAWQTTVHGVTKGWTRVSDFHFSL